MHFTTVKKNLIKKQDTKKYLLYDSIYLRDKNEFVVLDARIMVTLG